MRTGEKLIPKKVLLDALHEILEAAQNPEAFAAKHFTGAVTSSDARAFSLGWIESSASNALRVSK